MRGGEQLFILAVLSVPAIAWANCQTYPCEYLISVLMCTEKNLKDLSHIYGNDCYDLTTLLINENDLTELEDNTFQLFPNAKGIDLRNNKIDKVSEGAFSTLTKLQEILLDGNLLKDLSSLSLPAVIKLSLKGNSLGQNGNLSGPKLAPNLQELVLSECRLSTFGTAVLSNMPKLTYLDLSNNQLQELDSAWFQTARSVTTLNLSDNKIASLNINNANLGNLRILDLSNNSPLRTFDNSVIENMPQLQSLLLSGTSLQIPTDRPMFSHGAITHLSLANALSSITQLPADFLSELPALQWLDLSDNRLLDVKELFNTSAAIKVIILSGNGLVSVTENTFKGTPRLEGLYLDANLGLDSFSLSAVDQLDNLRVLDVSNTRFACYCSNDLWTLQLWANLSEIEIRDSCGSNLPCEWEDVSTEAPSTEKCWVSVNYCPAGQKCCRSGVCATKCAGTALIALPLTILILGGILIASVRNE